MSFLTKLREARGVLASGLALVLLGGALVGCSAKVANSPRAGEDGSGKKPGGVTTIEYWHINSEDFGGPAVRDMVKAFNEAHPNIKVVEKFQPGSYKGLMQNAQAAMAARKPPAVAQVGYNFLNYASENLPHLSIQEAAARDTADLNFLKENFLPSVLDLGQVNGKLEGMPFAISNPIMYYNADLFRRAGLDPNAPPATWDDVRQYARVIKEKTGNYGVYVQEPPDNWAQQALIESNGARMLIQDGSAVKTGVDSPESVEAYGLMAEMVLTDGTALHVKWEEGIQAFVSGKVAMLVTTIAKRKNVESLAKFEVRTSKFPTFGGKPRRVPAGGNALFIFAQDPKEQAAAWEFVKFMVSGEALTIWVKGTGYLPPRKGVAEDARYLKPFMDANPLMKAALDQLPDVVQWASFPGKNGLQAEQALLDARDDILGGKKLAGAALREAAARVNGLIK